MGISTVKQTRPLNDRVHRLRWWTLAVLSMSLLVVGLDNTVLNVAIPTMQREFGASASTLQWIVDAYIVVFAGSLLTMGALGDRFGRKKALQVGLVLIGAGSLGAAFATSVGQLIALRAVIGTGAALAMPSTLSVIVNVFPKEERTRAIAVWSSVAMLGIVIGPIVGGWLLEHVWWGSIFLLHGPFVAVALVAGWFLVPESRDEHARRLDIRSSVLSMVALSTLVFAVIEAPVEGLLSLKVAVPSFVAVAAGVTFVVRQLRVGNPLLDVRLFQNRQFAAGVAPIAILSLGVAGVGFLAQQYMQVLRGYGPLEASLRLFLPIIAGNILGASVSPKLEKRLGTRAVMTLGLVIAGVFYTAFIALEADTPYWMLAAGVVGIAVGMGMASAPATSTVMGAVPGGHSGVGSAVNDATREIGTAMGIAVMGSIANWTFSGGMDTAVQGLPDGLASSARDSIIGALGVAHAMGGQAGEMLAVSARASFMDALGIAFVAAGVMVFAAAALVWRFMPDRKPAKVPQPEVLVAPASADAATATAG